MAKDYIALNHNYSRSEQKVIPVIRKEDVYPETGAEITLGFQYVEVKAEIILKTKEKAKNIPDSLLSYDTNSKNRKEAIKILENSLKIDVYPEKELTILFLKIKD